MTTYRTEFPDFPSETMPAIPADWTDVSWHNDTSPSFEPRDGVRVFVDYADESRREVKGQPRFTVIDDNGNGGDGELLIATDDWTAAVLAAMAA